MRQDTVFWNEPIHKVKSISFGDKPLIKLQLHKFKYNNDFDSICIRWNPLMETTPQFNKTTHSKGVLPAGGLVTQIRDSLCSVINWKDSWWDRVSIVPFPSQRMSLLFPALPTADSWVPNGRPSFPGKGQPPGWPQPQLSEGQQKCPPLWF